MRLLITIAILLAAALAFAATAIAQTGGTYDLTWSTVDGGGGASSGGGYVVSGTAGQPDAGFKMSGGSYDLGGGFWGAAIEIIPLGVPVPGLTAWGLILLAATLLGISLVKARSRRGANQPL